MHKYQCLQLVAGAQVPADYVGPMPSYHNLYLQTHPWRFVDGATGKTLQEWTASTGEQTVSLTNDSPSPPTRDEHFSTIHAAGWRL